MERWIGIVAERDLESRNLLDKALAELNCDVVAAATQEGIDAAMHEHRSALLWIAASIPGVDPFRVSQRARVADDGSYYVALSLDERTPRAVTVAFEAGVDEVFPKPLVPAEVAARLKRVGHLFALERLRKTAASEGGWLAEIATTRTFYSQRYLETQLDTEVARSQRFSHSLALILAEFPDRDERVTRRYGQLLSSQLRAHIDWVARYGAQRIAVVLPETSLGGALRVAERLRARFTAALPGPGKSPGLSMNLGITAFGLAPQGDSQTLLAAAEAYLDEAVRKGSNQIAAGPAPRA